jgi:hypothetical protein
MEVERSGLGGQVMLVDHFVLGVAALRSIPAINVVYLVAWREARDGRADRLHDAGAVEPQNKAVGVLFLHVAGERTPP